MEQQEKVARLNELNRKCMKCREDSIKDGFLAPNPKSCLSVCEIGREIHELENPEWDAQDWNSSKLKEYYGN